MYCYTVANSYMCVLRELLLWSEISSEHPIFIKTVANLTNKNLSKEIIENLENINEEFKKINEEVKSLLNQMNRIPIPSSIYSLALMIKELIRKFYRYDRIFLDILKDVMEYGKEDKVWQTLLEHITQEQTYMARLVQTLYQQI